MTPLSAVRPKAKMRFNEKCFLFIFRLCFIFASINKTFTVASHNLHGFKKSSAFHRQCLQQYGGIWFGQEHWLPENRLSQLNELGTQFVARSGMEDAVSNGIMRGRPYGGVSITWSSDMDHVIRPLVNYRHKRVVSVEAAAEPHPLLFICVYMPFFDSSKRQECLAETIETISMLEEMLSDHPLHSVIIGGDLNTELKGNSPFDSLWNNLMAKFNLVCCDQFVNNNNNNNNNNYTYIHNSLNQKKWNDHFLVSSPIAPSTDGHVILDAGDNTSDHLPIMFCLSSKVVEEPPKEKQKASRPSLKWEKCSEQDKTAYANRLSMLLPHHPSIVTSCNVAHCKKDECISSLQAEYDLITQIIGEADKVLPRHKPGVQKHWWSDELSLLRNRSIDIHRLWQSEGKPRSGATNDERLRVRAAYKRAIKFAKTNPKQVCWDRMHSSFASKNTADFWKSWKRQYSKNKSDLHSVVDGITTHDGIANTFKSHFVKVSQPNDQRRVDQLNRQFDTEYRDAISGHNSCSCSSHRITLENVIDSVFSMKKGKTCDDSSIHAEHFFNAPLPLFERLQCLFNGMLMHEYVPRQFQSGTIVPIVKDRHGDKGDLNNYRGITIAPIISKVFEHTLRIIFQPFLSTSSYQFGFKRKSSTSLAIHCLKETINYYTSNGSNVYCSFLDASKAFDRLVHAGLFLKLLQRKVPLIFLNIMISWYSNLQCRVRWGDTLSDWFSVKAGVRQGGVLSPDLYCIYVDDLVHILSAMGIGCHLRDTFLALLLYADDMALLSPSLGGLQKLLSATETYCKEWDILLNASKTKNMFFGKRHSLPALTLDGKEIQWVESWKYLGVTLLSHKQFNCCINNKVKSFYRCANAILRIDGRSNEMVMLQLMESQCISILTYAIEVICVANRDERRRLRVAYNSVFRKIFGYRDWESVTELQHALKRPTWEELVEKRTAKFTLSVSQCLILNY